MAFLGFSDPPKNWKNQKIENPASRGPQNQYKDYVYQISAQLDHF